jgi:hypothetical protein
MSRLIRISTAIFAVIFFIFTFFPGKINAESQTSCSERFVTLVNPIRGRDLWYDKSLKPLTDQYLAAAKYGFPATRLFQYDALTDDELIGEVRSFEVNGENGVFLEISKKLADKAAVTYPSGLKWSNPGILFLSAYSQSERRLLIDTLFDQFKEVFGHYPESVGAWWIDSYSLNYIKEKYGLSAILIVADQKTTDSYGVWGQWWGYPYYPSKNNVLVPAAGDSLNAVVIQWAQRDPILAYGEGSFYSNFSLQANDYIRSGKDTDYFKSLVNFYLNCENPIGQITIGLETGMESAAFHGEYLNQLKAISEYNGLKVVTMSDFAKAYRSVNKQNPTKVVLGEWRLTPTQRENITLGDSIQYLHKISFGDYFIADKSSFLDRRLPITGLKNMKCLFLWFLVVSFILGLIALRKRKFTVWVSSTLFAVASFGLFYRSTIKNGWQVFYGPQVKNITFTQCLSILVIFALFYLIFVKARVKFKDKRLLMCLLPFSFGLDKIVSAFRYSVIDGNHVVGFLVERTRIIGLALGSNSLALFDKDYPILQTLAFLKFPIDKIWQNPTIYFILYPLVHVILAAILYLLLVRARNRVRILILVILAVFLIIQLIWIFGADPGIILAS